MNLSHRLLVRCWLLLAGLTLASAATAQPTKPPTLPELAKKYNLDFVTREPAFPVAIEGGAIDGKAATPAEVEQYLDIFTFEWSLYPPELVKRTRLKKIVFCKELSFAKQLRTAVPDFANDVLYLDVLRGRSDANYVRKVIHHEFFHIIDIRDDGLLYEDERWTQLNPRGFKYGSGGASLQDDPTVTVPRSDPGFLNRYAAAGVEEDKAEVFAHLMVEPKLIAKRAGKDKYLRAKVDRLKELLADFCPKMDETFWKAVESAERPTKQ
jgi:hypothetical protein